MRSVILGALVIAFPFFAWADRSEDSVYTLYRTSPVAHARIHVATFCVKGEAPTYNQRNCQMVVRALLNEAGVPNGCYWCEPGQYRETNSTDQPLTSAP